MSVHSGFGGFDLLALLLPPFSGSMAKPEITDITILGGGYRGQVILAYQSFVLHVNDLATDADVRLFVNGQDAGLGARQNDTDVLFDLVILPIGPVSLTVQQERDGEVSDLSEPITATVNTVDNTALFIRPPVILAAYGTQIASPLPIEPATVSFRYPVNISIRGVSGADIYYCVDASGYSQPTILYQGVFKVYQTSVIKVKQVYRRVKSFMPLESVIVKRTIRIIR